MDVKFDQAALMEIAAQKIADDVLGDHGGVQKAFEDRLNAEVDGFLSDEVRATLSARIEERMAEEVEAVLNAEILPVDMWGQKSGDPTTIRDQIHKRALSYWNEKVEPDRNNRGMWRVTEYGGTKRSEAVFKSVAKDAFDQALRENVVEIVATFKKALISDSAGFIAAEIEKHIKIPTKR